MEELGCLGYILWAIIEGTIYVCCLGRVRRIDEAYPPKWMWYKDKGKRDTDSEP